MALSTYARSLGIGAVAGLRSMTAPAATLVAGDNAFAGLAVLAAAGGAGADKLPGAPAAPRRQRLRPTRSGGF